MKTKIFLTNLFLFFTLSTFAQKRSLQEVNLVISAANKGIIEYLEKIPKGKESSYGFRGSNEYKIAKIGKPYEVFTLSNEFFSDKELKDQNYLVSTNEWSVPIMVNGEYRTLLTVAKINGKWKVVGLGASSLAKELGSLEKKYPLSKKYGMILRVYQIESDFILINSSVYPLSSAKTAFGGKENTNPYSINELLSLIKKYKANK